ncbi:MAG: uracil-DNA glycosylase [Desulfurococcales archaeon]|nr:uracil-DNA glycosylase [Desulfurococcales archaeon]
MNEENKETLIRIIEEEIRRCRKCPLHESRTNPVPGEGSLNAEIMFVGEAPGKNEDIQGRPFVGKAGELLNELLTLIGLKRSDVYITNVVKCRPPRNRDPRPEEVKACLPYLRRQIRIIKPKIIVCLGRFAGSTLFELAGLKWEGMYRSHGRVYEANIEGLNVYLVATFHPASAFYKKEVRSILERDFKDVIRRLIGEVSRKPARKSLLDFM